MLMVEDVCARFIFVRVCVFLYSSFWPASWSSDQSLTTNHEVPGSIPDSTVGIFPEGEDSCGDHGLGRLVEFRFKGPPWHSIILYHHSHHRYNVTAPRGLPRLRSRLRCCHAQEGGPRSPQGHVVGKKRPILRRIQWNIFINVLSSSCEVLCIILNRI